MNEPSPDVPVTPTTAHALREPLDSHYRLVYQFQGHLLNGLGILVAEGPLEASLEAFGRRTPCPPVSDYDAQLARARTVSAQRRALARNGILSRDYPEDAASALGAFRHKCALKVWTQAQQHLVIEPYSPDSFLPAPGEAPLTMMQLQINLGDAPFEDDHPCAALAQLMRYLQQSALVGRPHAHLIRELLDFSQAPPYWILLAAGAMGVITHQSALPTQLAPLAGLLFGASQREFVDAHRALIHDRSLLGSLSHADLVFRVCDRPLSESLAHLPSEVQARIGGLFALMGKEAVVFSEAQKQLLRDARPKSAMSLAAARYQAGRLMRPPAVAAVPPVTGDVSQAA